MIDNQEAPSEELLNCPFCGGEARLWEGDWATTDHGVVCTQCEVTLDPANYKKGIPLESEERAIAAWNTRAPSKQLLATQQALAVRSKQIGVACLKHDLTHSLKCGHCYRDMETQLKEARQALDSAAKALKAVNELWEGDEGYRKEQRACKQLKWDSPVFETWKKIKTALASIKE